MSDAKPRTSRTLEQDLERNQDIFSWVIYLLGYRPRLLLVLLVPMYSGTFLIGGLTHTLAGMTFWRHLSMFFDMFRLRKVTKPVRLRFCQVCPEYWPVSFSCKCFTSDRQVDTHPVHPTIGQRWVPKGDWGTYSLLCHWLQMYAVTDLL